MLRCVWHLPLSPFRCKDNRSTWLRVVDRVCTRAERRQARVAFSVCPVLFTFYRHASGRLKNSQPPVCARAHLCVVIHASTWRTRSVQRHALRGYKWKRKFMRFYFLFILLLFLYLFLRIKIKMDLMNWWCITKIIVLEESFLQKFFWGSIGNFFTVSLIVKKLPFRFYISIIYVDILIRVMCNF